MKAQHTPGPWVVGNYAKGVEPPGTWNECATIFVGPQKGADIVYLAHAWRDDAVVQANARLIAAAPEILQALQDLLVLADNGVESWRSEWDQARAAIAKATGGAE